MKGALWTFWTNLFFHDTEIQEDTGYKRIHWILPYILDTGGYSTKPPQPSHLANYDVRFSPVSSYKYELSSYPLG